MANPVIRIRDVGVVYRTGRGDTTLTALEKVSLDVYPGELVTVIGPSGCGKSTLLNAVGGLLKPTEGSIYIFGEPVNGPLPRKVAMVFQQYTLFPWRTILENVEVGLEFQGVPKKVRREVALKELAMVGLKGFEDYYPRQLSGGMKQRVAIARALSLSPEILLMDEPFGALDEQTRMILGEELSRILERTGKTIFFVTHSLGEAVYLSDRIAVMTARPGKIKEMVTVDLPRPREPKMMTSDKFDKVRNLLFELLHDESRRAMEFGSEVRG